MKKLISTIITLVLLIGGIWVFAPGVVNLYNLAQLRDNYLETQAVVVDAHWRWVILSTDSWAIVEYTVDDRVLETRVTSVPEDIFIGQVVTIYFSQENPYNAVLQGREGYTRVLVELLLAGAAILTSLIALLRHSYSFDEPAPLVDYGYDTVHKSEAFGQMGLGHDMQSQAAQGQGHSAQGHASRSLPPQGHSAQGHATQGHASRSLPAAHSRATQGNATQGRPPHWPAAVGTTAAPSHPTHGTTAPNQHAQGTGQSSSSLDATSAVYHTTHYLRDKIKTLYSQVGNLDGFYLFEEIPHHLLANAKSSYAQAIDPDEPPICLYDDTVGNSAKDGFLITTKNLYSKNFAMEPNAAQIPSITNMTVPKFGWISTNIHVALSTGRGFEVHVTKPRKQAEIAFSMLINITALLNGRRGA